MNNWVKEPAEQAKAIQDDIRQCDAIDNEMTVDEIEESIDPSKPLAVNSQAILEGLIDTENAR